MNFNNLTNYLDSLYDLKCIPARELIVYKNHEIIYHHMSGFSNQEQKKELNGKEIYLLYSSTKVSTCVAALRLIERGLLSLEDKVSDYISEFESLTVVEDGKERPSKTDLLIKHLFTMCGGFTYDLGSENLLRFKNEEDATTLDIVKAMAKEKLIFDPGTHWSYSICHDILAGVIEVVSGKSFEQFLKEEIYLPLEMYDTAIHLNDEQKERRVVHYIYDSQRNCVNAKKNFSHEFLLSPNYESGGAGVYSTTSDYAKLCDALACGGTAYNGYQVLKPETVELLSKNCLNEIQLKDFHDLHGHLASGYGLGVMMLLDKTKMNLKCANGIFGWGGMAGTKVFIDTKNRISIYYSQEVVGGPECSYQEHQHNVIADMVYQTLGIE